MLPTMIFINTKNKMKILISICRVSFQSFWMFFFADAMAIPNDND